MSHDDTAVFCGRFDLFYHKSKYKDDLGDKKYYNRRREHEE